MTITVEEINEGSIEVSFSHAMAPGTSGGGSDTISGTIIRDGQGVDISSPSTIRSISSSSKLILTTELLPKNDKKVAPRFRGAALC